MTKTLLITALALVLFASCNMVKFAEPQPAGIKNLDKMPPEVNGMFVGTDNDTLVVNLGYFSFKSSKSNTNINMTLGDSTVVRKYQNYIFMSNLEKDGWNLVVAEPKEGDRLTLYMLYTDNSDQLARIKKIISLTEKKNAEGETDYYIAKPTKEQLVKLLKQGLFREVVTLTKPLKVKG